MHSLEKRRRGVSAHWQLSPLHRGQALPERLQTRFRIGLQQAKDAALHHCNGVTGALVVVLDVLDGVRVEVVPLTLVVSSAFVVLLSVVVNSSFVLALVLEVVRNDSDVVVTSAAVVTSLLEVVVSVGCG